MNRKKIFLIGSLSSIHIYNYIKNVLSMTDFDITVYHTNSLSSIRKEYMDYYRRVGINIIGGFSILEVGRIKYIISIYKGIKSLGNFDFLHMHYVSYYFCPIIYLFRKKFKFIILSYWGSDLLRSSLFKRLLTLPLINHSKKISFMTQDMLDYFGRLSYPFKKNIIKCSVEDLGSLYCEKIDSCIRMLSIEKKYIYNYFGLQSQKKTIVIGYCGRKEMRQYETINSLLQLPKKVLSSIQLLIPAFGITSELKSKIENLCNENNLSYHIYDKFMDFNEIPKFRCISDIFIHAQTTDALSAAMLEHLYAGSIVLNGSWLKYTILQKHHVKYFQFSNFEELPNSLIDILNNYDVIKEEMQENRSKLVVLLSWEHYRSLWLNLYHN